MFDIVALPRAGVLRDVPEGPAVVRKECFLGIACSGLTVHPLGMLPCCKGCIDIGIARPELTASLTIQLICNVACDPHW